MPVQTKRVAGPANLAVTNPGAFYTAPASGVTSVVITGLMVSNARTDSTVVVYSIAVLPAGATYNTTVHSIISNRSLAPGDAPDIFKTEIILAPGDALYAVASNGGVVLMATGAIFS